MTSDLKLSKAEHEVTARGNGCRVVCERPLLCLCLLTTKLAQCLAYVLGNRGTGVQFLTETTYSSLLHSVKVGCGAQAPLYSVGTWGAFPWVKATRARN
jgi:hypothetical protein